MEGKRRSVYEERRTFLCEKVNRKESKKSSLKRARKVKYGTKREDLLMAVVIGKDTQPLKEKRKKTIACSCSYNIVKL